MSRSVLDGSAYSYKHGEDGDWDVDRQVNVGQRYVEEEEDSAPEYIHQATSSRKQSLSRVSRSKRAAARASATKNMESGDLISDSSDSSLPPYGYIHETDESWMHEVEIMNLTDTNPAEQSLESLQSCKDVGDQDDESNLSGSGSSVSASEIKRRLGIVSPSEPGRMPFARPTIILDEEISLEDLQEAFELCIKDEDIEADKLTMARAIRFNVGAPNLADEVLAVEGPFITWEDLLQIAKPFLKIESSTAIADSQRESATALASSETPLDTSVFVSHDDGLMETNTQILDFDIVAPPTLRPVPYIPERSEHSSGESSVSSKHTTECRSDNNSIDLSGDDESVDFSGTSLQSTPAAKVKRDLDVYHSPKVIVRESGGSDNTSDSGVGYFDDIPDAIGGGGQSPAHSTIKAPAIVIRKMTTTVRNVSVSESLPPSTPENFRNRLSDRDNSSDSPNKAAGRYSGISEVETSVDSNEGFPDRQHTGLSPRTNDIVDVEYGKSSPPSSKNEASLENSAEYSEASPVAAAVVEQLDIRKETEIPPIDDKSSHSLYRPQKPPLPPTRVSQLSNTDNLMSTQSQMKNAYSGVRGSLYGEQFPLDFSANFQPPPLSLYATRAEYIYEGWIEKRSSQTGLWLKRYLVLAESRDHVCMLMQFSRAVESVWGMIPLDLKKVIPISNIVNVDVSTKPRHFSITEVGATTRSTYANIGDFMKTTDSHTSDNYSDGSSVNSDSAFTDNSSGQHILKLRSSNPEERLCWVTFIQKARALVIGLGRE